MQFTYTAKNKDGQVYTAAAEARDKLDLYAKVHSEGGAILKVSMKRSRKSLLPSLSLSGASARDKIVFAKNLSSMLTAGLSLPRALGVMEKETRKGNLKKLFNDLAADVNHGEAFSQALAKMPNVFPSLFVSMVKAGEESGDLSGALKVISGEMEKSYMLTRRVRGAMVYPVIILTLMIVISILLLIYMVPTLTSTFSGLNIQLPWSTRAIIASSGFLVTHTLEALSSLAFIILAALVFLRSVPGRKVIDVVLLKLPLIGNLTKEIESARTTRTLSSLLSAGVPVVNALEVTTDVVPNHLYKQVLEEARASIQRGETLSSVFSKRDKLYPPFVSEMTAVGEETGKLSEMLADVAKYYEEDVDEKTKDLSTVIEPLLMLLVGVAVGVFAISMLAPTYSLVNTIQ